MVHSRQLVTGKFLTSKLEKCHEMPFKLVIATYDLGELWTIPTI